MNKLEVKKVVFVSNYFNHHQRPLADALYKIYGKGYKFIETQPITDERKNMGWGESTYPDYVVSCEKFIEDKDFCLDLINEADIVIIGAASNTLIENRIKNKKNVFRYTERPLKDNKDKWKYIVRLFTWRKLNPQNGHMYLLCSSAYASGDYAKFGLYINKAFKFGYFTELKKYDNVDKLIDEKKSNSLLWCSRFIPLKHPETIVEVAKRLKNDGYDFTFNVIGTGEMEHEIKETVIRENLGGFVNFLGSMKPQEVRQKMEEAEIFLFTSDRNEGWGAVLNESMNSACAVVASHAIGSVPFLVSDKENGLIYNDGDIQKLYQGVKWLIDNPIERKRISKNAYYTMLNEWNAENAANKFSKLCEAALNGQKLVGLFKDGVCSKAKKLKDSWCK